MDKAREFVKKRRTKEGNFVFTPDDLKTFVDLVSKEAALQTRKDLMRSVQEYILAELSEGV